MNRRRSGFLAAMGLMAGVVWILPTPARAKLADMELDDASDPAGFLFPNWKQAETTIFDTEWCDPTLDPVNCAVPDNDATIIGLTILNYGTATGGAAGDITGMYACFDCSTAPGPCNPASGTGATLTYAGMWPVPSGTFPAWTWAGSKPLSTDPCTTCACIYWLRLFVDVGPCAVPGHTVILGPGFNDLTDPVNPGGLYDGTGNDMPDAAIKDSAIKTIEWITKQVDKNQAAPGDTITYTVFYGLPGTTPLTNVIVTDSIPAFTHYIGGSGVPPPDPGWDPSIGPPMALRWTLTAPGTTVGGPTNAVTFKLTVDWGNGEIFEPGSGDTAAPEGAPLKNYAQAAFVGTSCATTGAVSLPVSAVVKRFLFWKIADNDMLFAPQPGRPQDEITYEIFVKNLSPTKTWWNVEVWDTAPAEIDPWAANEGLNDPCNGWTMTPSGCAAANAGSVIAGGKTILTWKLDLPPGSTSTLQWKGQVRAGVTAGATATNQVSLLEFGKTGMAGGTGSSVVPAIFTHQALIVLPTTYVSYVAMSESEDEGKIGCKGYFLPFFPLNKQTQFELRGIQHLGTAGAGMWSVNGGVSQSIGCLIGDCLGGFAGAATCALGSGAISGGGWGGCKIERTPAVYDPAQFDPLLGGACSPSYPLINVYKVVSNSPVLWQLLTHIGHDAQDNFTYAPSTNITYRGFMHYMWRRAAMDTAPGDGDALSLINTGMDAAGNISTTQTTTVHLFEFDYGSLTWDYMTTYNLGPESQAIDLGPDISDENPWRTISSDTQLIVYQGNDTINQGFCCCGCGDNYGGFCPNRENGNVVSQVGVGTFYAIVAGYANVPKVIVGNTGSATATYRILQYQPDNPVAVGLIPGTLADTSGSWALVGTDFVPPGIANAANPQIYGNTFNAASFSLWKVELTAGGPIQVMGGTNMFQIYSGGAVMHAADGSQTGVQYWFNQASSGTSCKGTRTQVIDAFCPKSGMVVRMQAENGYSAIYTTTGPDQCVAFLTISDLGAGKTNYVMNELTGDAMIAQYIQCEDAEKGYTAPFLQTGVHYTIIAPPVVFIGQNFWITVIVNANLGGTKTDYCGTTSFTSTDPAAQIAGLPMDAYNFTWNSAAACSGTTNENGVMVFINVIMTRLGLQTIVADDTTDGSITGLTAVQVVGVDVKLTKSPRLSIAASGDTVQFRMCWSNYSGASAFSFTVTDAVPMGTTFVPDNASNEVCGFSGAAVPVDVAYSTATSPTTPLPASFITAAGAIPGGVRWMRWTIKPVNVQTTGCVCYKVTVN